VSPTLSSRTPNTKADEGGSTGVRRPHRDPLPTRSSSGGSPSKYRRLHRPTTTIEDGQRKNNVEPDNVSCEGTDCGCRVQNAARVQQERQQQKSEDPHNVVANSEGRSALLVQANVSVQAHRRKVSWLIESPRAWNKARLASKFVHFDEQLLPFEQPLLLRRRHRIPPVLLLLHFVVTVYRSRVGSVGGLVNDRIRHEHTRKLSLEDVGRYQFGPSDKQTNKQTMVFFQIPYQPRLNKCLTTEPLTRERLNKRLVY
jgi:hypothetical protein